MNTHLTIIHLEKRTDRLEHLYKQLEDQNITDYTIVEGIIDRVAVFRGINLSHKRVIRLAKQQGMSNCIIGEDDLAFTGFGAWNYFLSQIPESYDMFFASVYEGKIDKNNRLVKGIKASDFLSGLTLYSVHSRFYDTFLGMKEMNHLDKELAIFTEKYEYYVCPEFCAIQMNGYSDNKKKECKYDHYMKGRKMFGV